MNLTLRILLLVATLVLLVIIFRTISKRTISVRYALMWILFTFVLLFFVIDLAHIESLASFLGFETTANMIFILVIASIILMLLSLTTIVSKQSTQIHALIQEVAILKTLTDEMDRERKNK